MYNFNACNYPGTLYSKMCIRDRQEAASVSGFLIHDGRQEAAEALIALGYSSTDAMKAVRKVTDVSPDDVEALLKACLLYTSRCV